MKRANKHQTHKTPQEVFFLVFTYPNTVSAILPPHLILEQFMLKSYLVEVLSAGVVLALDIAAESADQACEYVQDMYPSDDVISIFRI